MQSILLWAVILKLCVFLQRWVFLAARGKFDASALSDTVPWVVYEHSNSEACKNYFENLPACQ